MRPDRAFPVTRHRHEGAAGGRDYLLRLPSGRPALVIQGTADEVVRPANAARIARTGAPVRLRLVRGLGHGWSGGDVAGSHTAPGFPSATDEVLSFMRQGLSRSRRIWAPPAPAEARPGAP